MYETILYLPGFYHHTQSDIAIQWLRVKGSINHVMDNIIIIGEILLLIVRQFDTFHREYLLTQGVQPIYFYLVNSPSVIIF